MTTSESPLQAMELRHHDGEGASLLRDTIADVYSGAYGDRLHLPFYTLARFLDRFDRYVKVKGYELVTAHCDNTVVGLLYGFPRPPNSGSWKRISPPPPQEVTEAQTFALADMMVRVAWRRRGVARSLHDELLARRSEGLATLLVRPDNEPARAAYRKWGWQKIGEEQPFPDSPVYDVMILSLSAAAPGER